MCFWERGEGVPTDNLNIQKRRVQIKGGGWKLFSVKSGNPLSLIMGIASAKSRRARGVSYQSAPWLLIILFAIYSFVNRTINFIEQSLKHVQNLEENQKIQKLINYYLELESKQLFLKKIVIHLDFSYCK